MRRKAASLSIAAVLVAGLAVSAAADVCSQAYSACMKGCRRIPQSNRPGISDCISHCSSERAACVFPKAPTAPPADTPVPALPEDTHTPVAGEAPPPASAPAPAAAEEQRVEPDADVAPVPVPPREAPPEAPIPAARIPPTPIPAAPTTAAPTTAATVGECTACRDRCSERSAERLYRCKYECAETFRRSTKRDQQRCEKKCECDVFGCEGSDPGYSQRCLAECPCPGGPTPEP